MVGRADVVLAAIPALVLGGLLAERTTELLIQAETATDGALGTGAVPLFQSALLVAFAHICSEALTANAIEH